EEDFHRGVEEGIEVYTSRMFLEETTREGEEHMVRDSLPVAAEMIRTLKPQLTVFGCTSAGSLGGLDFDRQIVEGLEKTTGASAMSVLMALSEDFAHLGAKRLAVFTPYVEELNHTIRKSLEEGGFEVLSIDGMGIRENFAIGLVAPEEILRFAKERFRTPEADCLFFSCTNLAAVSALPLLRENFRLPIVTSNQAAINAVNRFYKSVKAG
ncbi:MAG: Asp/Glu racemase, partial [Nitrospinota bacterium]